MLQKLIKLLLLSLIFSYCSLKSNNAGTTDKVFYSDRNNPHAKMQLPVEVSWTHDKAGNPNQPLSIIVTARALSDLTNATVNLTLPDDLKLVNGELSKTVASLKTDATSELNLTVTPLKTGSFDINVLLNASLNGERIGTARTIRFQTSDYVAEKPAVHPSGLHIIEGKTDYGK